MEIQFVLLMLKANHNQSDYDYINNNTLKDNWKTISNQIDQNNNELNNLQEQQLKRYREIERERHTKIYLGKSPIGLTMGTSSLNSKSNWDTCN